MGTYRCKLSIISLLLVTCSLVLLTSSISISAKERRIALVIGNGAYKSSPLSNPVNDANDMAAALKKLGFSVKLRINANQRSMESSIRAFGKDLRSGGVGLFYFAGHGLQVHGRNYLIPIDAKIESEADVKYESVDAGRVLSQMYEAENGLNIIVLDACRDNPYARSFRSSEKGLAKMDAPTGSILAYATAPGSVAADGTGRNGLYTSKLLKHMMSPGLAIERVLKNVRIEVMKDSGMRQVPWESSSLTGDFYFNTKRGIAVVQYPIDTGLDVERKRLEQERKEFEGIKAEIEELKKLEAERKRIEAEKKKLLEKETNKYASISPKVAGPKEIESDGRFIAYDNGTVKDTKTGLMWASKDNGKDINWNDAKRYCENYRGGGYTDWRMPTQDELAGLYDNSESYQAKHVIYDVHLTRLIQFTNCCPWASETRGSRAAYFNFGNGNRYWYPQSHSSYERALPVRSGK